MSKYFLPCLTVFFCLFCSIELSAQQLKVSQPAAAVSAATTEQSGFDILKSTMDQVLGAIAPAAEKFAKHRVTLAEAKEFFKWAKGWNLVAKFFGGGLDCLNSLKNGWDIGTAINGCISALQGKDYPEFKKQFNEFAKTTVKGIAAIATTALITAGGTAGVPVLALVGAGLAIGVATDYVVSKIDLTKQIDWVKNTWNSFRKDDPVPLLISVDPDKGYRQGGGKPMQLKNLDIKR